MSSLLENVPRGTIEKYIELLLEWNKKINLISFENIEELINRHIEDSLELLKYIPKNSIIYDLGAGAGFPGLMLSFAGMKEVHLVEKINKKANFLRVASLISENQVFVHNNLVEKLEIEQCDVICARGFAELDKIFLISEKIHPLNPKFFLLKGKKVEEEIKKALEKWDFEYIIHKSELSEQGCILEINKLNKKNAKNNSNS